MALIEGFRVQNYRALKDITIGRLSGTSVNRPLSPFTVVIGKNGSGKSTLFDAFGFVSDCLAADVESACDMKQRGGFERLRSMGAADALRFEVYYREAPNERPITYELAIALDDSERPFVESEVLKQRRKGQKYGRPYPFLRLHHGKGMVWAGEEAVEMEGEEDRAQEAVELTDLRQLGIATLGTLREHPRIKRFRDFLKGWYLSYFYPDAARGLPSAGPQRHLNVHGDNIGNVVQFMQREHEGRFKTILKRIATKIPGISGIDTHVTEDKRVLLRFNDGAFQDPFFAQQMSDGTLKIFAYLLLLGNCPSIVSRSSSANYT
jgi:predicted ATPase